MSVAAPDPASSTRDGVQILGLVRFSVPSIGGFRDKDMDLDTRRAALYDPARLALRFAFFEHLILPAMAAQKDPAFRLIIMLGADFPEPWRARMQAHVATHPQLVAEYVEPGPHRPLCAEVMARHVDPDAEVIAQFRLDDDDTVAVDYTKRIRRDFRRARTFFVEQGGLMAIDYVKGLYVAVEAGQVSYTPRIVPFVSVAEPIFTTPGDGNFVLNFPHTELARHMAVLHLRDDVMYLRGAHGSNDSNVYVKGRGFPLDPSEVPKLLRRRFRFDAPRFEAEIARLHAAG